MNQIDFQGRFERLTGFQPLPWQTRLFFEYFHQGRLPAGVDVPTGLGKTAVMALWLVALQAARPLPRRLVYVVDRRAVVDQATAFVEAMRERLPAAERFPVSTLRGQHLDNREWLDDPGQPAIIVGTVDMIGSRLLFSGYGVSRKMRPYHAGLLGADTLVVLDEAHLVPPFERLLADIEADSAGLGAKTTEDRALIPRLRLLSLSATGRARQGEIFSLREEDLGEPGSITRQRLNATKCLTLKAGDPKQRVSGLANAAWELCGAGTAPMRCLVYCNSRDDAEKVCGDLANRIKAKRKDKTVAVNLCDPELLIGARRGHEREAVADSLAALGFLAGTARAPNRLTFLVATSAGEVGVDLDADHMVCDLVAWERMVQRLGRVNRRGDGDARIMVIDFGPLDPKSPPEAERHPAMRAVLRALPEIDQGLDASPGALRALKLDADPAMQANLALATTPAPLRPPLDRPLLDAWSMTTLREHTGRPQVQPWLRGWQDDEPQTVLVWRAHLPLSLASETGLEHYAERAVATWFEAAPPHAAERLETATYRVADWIVARAKALVQLATDERQPEAEPDTLRPQQVVAFALTGAGDFARAYRLGELAAADKRRLVRELTGKTLVLRHAVGGLAGMGTLEPKHAAAPAWVADDEPFDLTGSSLPEPPVIPWRVVRRDDGDEDQPTVANSWHLRHRFVVQRDPDGEIRARLAIYQWRQAAETEDGRALGYTQTLAMHQACAEAKARRLIERLALPGWIAEVLTVAARLHDEGKQSPRWQAAFHAPRDGEIYAKTKGPIDQQLLDGYRHELGSLFHAERDPRFLALAPDQQDLVLHLIAAHHGRARPTITTRGCEAGPPSVLDGRVRDVALRFARLQRRWGPWGLAWLEALLRAADQQASKDAANGGC